MAIIFNHAILWLLGLFVVLGAIDRVLKQFDGSPRLLAWLGLTRLGAAIDGAGKQFEEGFNVMGPLALAMCGIIAVAPLLGRLLAPVVIPIYRALGADPAMFATSLLALDMGGFNLAKQLALVNGHMDWAAALYAGIILGSMMGATIVFTIPVGLGLVGKSDRKPFALGILIGLATIPVGCLAGGATAMYSNIHSPDGALVFFTLAMLLRDLVPVILLSAFLIVGLWKFPEPMIRGFLVFAKVVVAFMTVTLAVVVVQNLTGLEVVRGLDPIFPVRGDRPGIDIRAIELIGRIAITLAGAYPAAFLLSRWCNRSLLKAGRLLNINEAAAAGLMATLASNLPMFKMLGGMNERGKVINVAFSVSAAWVIADHLAFVAASQPDMILATMVGKVFGGISAICLAMFITRRFQFSKEGQRGVTNA